MLQECKVHALYTQKLSIQTGSLQVLRHFVFIY